MTRRLVTILITAFVIAGLCSYLVVRIVGNRLTAPVVKTTTVIAAANDLPVGTIITAHDLGTTEIAGSLPPGVFTKQADVLGRGVISPIYKGEAIIGSRLAAKGAGGGLAATIPKGMRACAVRVDDVVGLAGFVTPGKRVDVLVSGNPPGSTGGNNPLVHTLLQNIEVLSAGTNIQKDANGKPEQVQVVNLLVTPKQAEKLSLASTQTHIQLVLRNPLDTKKDKLENYDLANIYEGGIPPRRPAYGGPMVRRAAAPPPFVMEVINGTNRSDTKFASHKGQP
jgi:pilus assembly protein CpaB